MQKLSFLPVVLIISIVFMVNHQARSQEHKENFTPFKVDTVKVLSAKEQLGGFNYTLINKDQPSEASSILCQFDGDGSILIGLKKPVTEIRIACNDKKVINFKGFRASLINSYNNESQTYKIQGYRNGTEVTLEETVEINTVKLPGLYVNFEQFPGFNQIDELRIKGDNLKLTLEEFVYQNGTAGGVPVTASN